MAPRPRLRHAILLAGALLCAPPVAANDEREPSGTVRIEQVQIAWIGSGNLGGGTLDFAGRRYKFSVGGLGIGGFGISKLTAVGEVYALKQVRDFSGSYVQGRYGFAGGTVSAGELWLQNGKGVVLHLKADRVGLALSLGADAVYIKLDS